jgi:hypothetical protein
MDNLQKLTFGRIKNLIDDSIVLTFEDGIRNMEQACARVRPFTGERARSARDVFLGMSQFGRARCGCGGRGVALSDSSPKQTEGKWSRLPQYTGRCNVYWIKVPSRRIGFVNGILEAYEWIARIRTMDVGRGILEIVVPSEWDDWFQDATARMAESTLIQFIKWDRE